MVSAMGPCELPDYVGVDVAVNVSRYFAQTLGPDYGPPANLVRMVEEGPVSRPILKTNPGFNRGLFFIVI